MAASPKLETTKETWIADSGASSHLTNNDAGLTNVSCPTDEVIQVASGQEMRVEKKGMLMLMFEQKGIKREMVLKDVKYVPGVLCNLFSLMRGIDSGGNSAVKE